MACLMRKFLIGFFLLAFSSVFSQEVMAQDKDQDVNAKIKSLEELEARIDAKLKRLETLEARLEARLSTSPQPVAARGPGGGMPGGNGQVSMPTAIGATSAAGASAGQDLETRVKHLEEESIHQVMFRGGFTSLTSSAQSAVFTGSKNDTSGWNIGAVIGVKLLRDPFFNNLVMGEVSLDYSRISGNTQFALGKSGNQSLFKVSVAPKYRIDNLGDLIPSLARVRPWITPIGLSFLVNSPPSDSAAYLTVGGTTGVGFEYLLHDRVSVGLGLTYNFYDRTSNRISTNHLTIGPYIGINY